MARTIRRVEPWCGVSQPMIEAEARSLGREVEQYLAMSLADPRQKLSERGKVWNQVDEALHAVLVSLPERDQLAIQCLLVRDGTVFAAARYSTAAIQ